MTSKKAAGGGKGVVKKLKLKKETVRDLDVRKNAGVKGGLLKGNIGAVGKVGTAKAGSGQWTGVDCDANSCGPKCTGDLRCI